MSLPSSWIDVLFARLAVRYGEKWERMYPEIDTEVLKADWAEVLDGVAGDSIAYGIVNLPLDWPPNAMQFREICRHAPARPLPLEVLAGPQPDPAKAAAIREAIKRAVQGMTTLDPKAWAWKLKARDEAGESLTVTQRAMYRVVTQGAAEMSISDEDRKRTAELKEKSAREVREYARKHGIDMP